jgi:hypothetical protein
MEVGVGLDTVRIVGGGRAAVITEKAIRQMQKHTQGSRYTNSDVS